MKARLISRTSWLGECANRTLLKPDAGLGLLMAAQDALRHTLDNLALAGNGDEDQAYRLSMLRRIGGSEQAITPASRPAEPESRVIEIEYRKGRAARGDFSVLPSKEAKSSAPPVEFIELSEDHAFDDVAEAEAFGWVPEDEERVGFSLSDA